LQVLPLQLLLLLLLLLRQCAPPPALRPWFE